MSESIDINSVEQRNFAAFAKQAMQLLSGAKEKTVNVSFVSEKKMCELNQTFRGKNSATDVLSFPFAAEEFEGKKFMGDIVISTEQAQNQALANNLPFEREVRQLILHGVLHLCGYDHETDNGEMNSLELKFRDKLGIN